MKTSSICMVLILWISALSLQAQNKAYNYSEARFDPYLNRFSVSIGLGTGVYDGEFAGMSNFFNQNFYLNPSLGAGLSYRFHERISARSEINVFRLSSKSGFTTPIHTREFSSINFDLYVSAVVDVFRQSRIEGRFRKWNPYFFGGAGMVAFFPHHNLEGGQEGAEIGIDTTYLDVKYSKISVVFPVGAGLSYYFNRYNSLSLEGNYRFTRTDYLDGYRSNNSPHLDKYLTVSLKYTFVIDREPTKSFIYQKYTYRRNNRNK